MAPLKFIVYAQLAVSYGASGCPNDLLDDSQRIAGSPRGSPVRTRHGRPVCTVPCFRRTSCSLQWRFSSSANVAGQSSGRAVRQPRRRSYRSYSPAGERFDNCSFYRDNDHRDDHNGHLYHHDRDHATEPEHWNWPLLILRTVGRKPVNIHQLIYSSKLVSCVSTLRGSFGKLPCPSNLGGFDR